MKKRNIFLSIAMLPLMALAQGFQAKNTTVDLGQIKWKVPSTATFSIKNTTGRALKVKDVDPGCGCLNVVFPKQLIEPGEQFELKATYDAKQLGHFARTICVWNDKEEQPIEVVLQGNVVKDVENFSGEYPHTIGGLLADVDAIEFDDINKGDVVTQEIHIFNPSGQYVTPVVMHLPAYLRADIQPKTLGPKKPGVLRLTMNSKQLRLPGLNQASIYLANKMGEKVSEDKEIQVSAIYLPVRMATDEASLAKSPKIQLSSNEVDMSNTAGKKKVKKELVIFNSGKSVLEISALQMFTQGLELTLPKRSLRPGESTKLKITGYTDILSTLRARPRILMITNDPTNPKVIIEVKK